MRALVLSGGGVKGAYQIGVLKKWMGEQGTDYDVMCGVSVGALNIAGLAQTPYGQPAVAVDSIEKFWINRVNTSAIYKRWWPFGSLHSLWSRSVYNSKPLQNLVRSSFNSSSVRNSGRKVSVGAISLDTGEKYYARETDERFIDWVLASSSYPIFLEPIEIGGQLWSDGGIREMTPLREAIKMGATDIDVIMCSTPYDQNIWTSKSKVALPDQAIRVLDLMSDQIMRSDLEIVGLKNDLTVLEPSYQNVKIRLVEPAAELVANSMDFNPQIIKTLLKKGYEDADTATLYF